MIVHTSGMVNREALGTICHPAVAKVAPAYKMNQCVPREQREETVLLFDCLIDY